MPLHTQQPEFLHHKHCIVTLLSEASIGI